MPDTLPSRDRPARLAARFAAIRAGSLRLTEGLSAEDMAVQSMPDASPVKWHLAHTTWFFETFVLVPQGGRAPWRDGWGYLFNSYYDAIGARHPRPQRGLLTRPGVAEVLDWRRHVDAAMADLLTAAPSPAVLDLVELGLNHEQQHQELILTDLKHLLSHNPMHPAAYARDGQAQGRNLPPPGWIEHAGGLVEIGRDNAGFAFDHEGPRHRVWLEPFRLADRPVSTGEWLAFMADGGYRTPSLWLADGWAAVQAEGWQAPAYWRPAEDGGWTVFTLAGEQPPDPAEPVIHVSHYEADAFARWAAGCRAGTRLPTEAEWEAASPDLRPATGVHPAAMTGPCAPGTVWEWTGSAYLPYPGYVPASGAVGEYNGKFMSGQMVLRGASCATPPDHSRRSYRNFFPPATRWQVTGLRLACSA